MSLFEKGKPKTGGRAKGARNKLSVAFLEAFAADFEEHGAEVIKIVRVEKPSEYLKTAAYLMPKEFEISETRLMEIPDDELDAFIEFARRRIAERALGAAEMSGTSDYIGSAAHSCSLSNLIHRAGLAHEIYSWLCRGLDHRCRRCGPGYVHRRASASSSMIEINAFAFSDISEPQRQ